jgi:hypothetical protein
MWSIATLLVAMVLLILLQMSLTSMVNLRPLLKYLMVPMGIVTLLMSLMAMVPLLASLIPMVNLRPLITMLMSLRLIITIFLISPLLGLVSIAVLGPLLHPTVPLIMSIQKLNLGMTMVVMSVVMVKKLYLVQSATQNLMVN